VGYSVRSIGDYLQAELSAGTVDAAAPVEGAVRLAEFVMAVSAVHATLVVGTPADITEALASGRTSLTACVLIIAGAEADDHLRAALRDAAITTMFVPAVPADVVHPRLVALIAADQAAEDRRVTTDTKVLTQVARRGGVVAVVAELAHRIDGWVVLLDAHGQMITTAGSGGLHVRDAVAVAFNRPVRVRHRGLQVHAVGQGEDISAHLVISARGSTSRSRDLGSQAAALLDLLLRTPDHPATERLGREVMLSTLLRGGPEAAELLRRWGVHADSLTAFAVASRSRSIDAERMAIRWLDELGAAHVLSASQGRVLGFIADDSAAELATIVNGLAVEGRMPLRLGLGSPCEPHALARSAAEARQSLEIALVDAQPVVWYQALATVSYVLEHLDDSATTRIAAVLDPLREDDGAHGALFETLQVYLAEHGAWGATATKLHVHRQTLATRIRRIEELTGLSMTNPDDRTAAWLAIRTLQNHP
jgi:PucR family transcriptional regulator, purine catabolism regulatory protein